MKVASRKEHLVAFDC